MKNTKLTKDARQSLAIICVTVLAYIAENMYEFLATPNKTAGIILAMVHTVILAAAIFTVLKTTDVFWGMLTALYGYKMLPVPILFLYSQSRDAHILYFFISKMAMIAFAVLIYKLYQTQKEPKDIKALPIIATMFAIPFFNTLSGEFMNYFLDKTGSMLFGYFSQFAFYAVASAVIIALAYVSTQKTFELVIGFEAVAVCINILKTAGRIAVRVMNNSHISKSLYVWLAVYIGILVVVVFAYFRKKKQNSVLNA